MTELVDPSLEQFWEQDPTELREPEPVYPAESHEALALEISAGVLAVLYLIRRELADEPEAPKDPRGAAAKLWRKHAPIWLRLLVPAIRQAYELGHIEGLSDAELEVLATSYAEQLGDYVADTSCDALVEGFDRQLAANWNERIAWQRAATGYGLDRREMRGYVEGLMHGKSGDIISPSARLLVDKALLARADRIGQSESWTATQTGQALAWMWLQRQGRLPADAQREWLTREDERECPVCGSLDRTAVELSAPFVLPNGEHLWAPQAHPGCRCRVRLVVPEAVSKKTATVGGLCVLAADTGRILLLQRALDPKDPVGGTWEFPGGHAEAAEDPLEAAEREWSEEVGRRLPRGHYVGSWVSGPYHGFVLAIPSETDVPIWRGRGSMANPDDPDGDAVEQLAWWDPAQLRANPAVRPELRASLPAVRRALSGDLAKAFDPDEPRDRSGRWSTRNAPPVLEREPEAEEAKAEPVNPYAAKPSDNPYATATRNPYASASPYAAAANPYAAPNPYAASESSSATQERAPGRRKVVIHHFLLPGVKRREPRYAPSHESYYLPVSDLADYYHDSGGRITGHGPEIDFTHIRAYYKDVRQRDNPIRTESGNSPWEHTSLTAVDDQDWSRLAAKAYPLWRQASEPETALALLDELDGEELREIASRAGYGGLDGHVRNFDVEDTREQILTDLLDPDPSDPSLREAYADYVTWQRADLLGANGEDFEHDVMATLGMNYVEELSTPSVIVFDYGFARGSGPDNVTGLYDVIHTAYRSALAEFHEAAPPGAIGVREFFVEPASDSPPGGAH